LPDARQAHGDEGKFRGGKEAVQRDQDQDADKADRKHNGILSSSRIVAVLAQCAGNRSILDAL
jgi:hypothetical protein